MRYSRETRAKISVQQPSVYQECNHGMEGVNKIDMFIACYRTRMRQRKCWWSIFAYLFDASVVNAWLLMRKICPKDHNCKNPLTFRRYLRLSLLKT